jgi:hypothetical protein
VKIFEMTFVNGVKITADNNRFFHDVKLHVFV